MVKSGIINVIVFGILWHPVWAQQQGGQQPPPSGQAPQTQQPTKRPDRQRPLFLTGKVVMADGREPGEQVRVELICQGTVRRQEYASSNGTFSMELNQGSQGTLQPLDASISSTGYASLGGGFDAGLGGSTGLSQGISGQGRSQNLSSCEVQAQLAGYQSDSITLGPRRALDNPDIGVIVLHRLDGRDGGMISLKTLAAPKDARKAYEKAGKELIKKKPNLSKATKELEKAVKIYEEFAAAWYMLGEVRMAQDNRSGASEAFEMAITADAEYTNPRVSLAFIALEEERWEDAVQSSEEALQISPNHIKAHYYNAVANSSLGNVDIAETSALKVHGSAEVQNFPLVHYVLGWIMSKRGDFDAAAVHYRTFMEVQPEARLAERLREQLTDWVEQGLIEKSDS
jgi:TolA-binding protein